MGLAGNLRDYHADGPQRRQRDRAAQIDYNGAARRLHARPAGDHQLRSRPTTTRRCSTPTTYKAPGAPRRLADRVRMQNLGIDIVAAGAGRAVLPRRRRTCCAPSRWTATATTRATGSTARLHRPANNWGVGPPTDVTRRAGGSRQRPSWRRPRDQADARRYHADRNHFQEMLAIRKSSALCSAWRPAQDIKTRCAS